MVQENQEEWKPVVGCEDLFEVSNLGRLRRTATGQIVKATVLPKGYRTVSIARPGQRKCRTKLLHSVVAYAFLGPRPDGMQINHKDGDKGNNAAENLEYVTPAENIRHCFLMGIRKKSIRRPRRYKIGL